MVRPFSTPASISTQGAWQMAPTGLPCEKKSWTKATTSLSARSVSAPTVPPGMTSPWKSLAATEPTPEDARNGVHRFIDEERGVVVYLAWSTKLVDGSPYNAVAVVPIR